MSIFSSVKMKRPKRNVFDLSHEVKFSLRMADLVPILCQDVVPGDSFRLRTEVMLRLAPLISPIMHRVNVYTHFFFVPNRLIWSDWENFITGGPDGSVAPVLPHFKEIDAFSVGSLGDYFGFPVNVSFNYYALSVLPFRAYQLIYNEYYRDQNLMDPVPISLSSGLDTADSNFVLRQRCWEKDYFTSALPWTQRGGDVHLPLSGDAPVVVGNTGVIPEFYEYPSGGNPGAGSVNTDSSDRVTINGSFVGYDPKGSLEADLSHATSATINELREAVQLQSWLERNARGGARYIEQILSHFGVKSSDSRLQRPEYLGGGKSPLVISEVLQTSSTDETSPQANMSGHGISIGASHSFKRFFEEHGQVIGIMSVLPRTAYQQGVPRQFQKFDKFDYYFPEFAHLGEQPVFNGELYADGSIVDHDVFGYQSRFAEYKYVPSRVAGEFRDTLDFWHMGRKFASRPNLNGNFVTADPTTRVFAVEDSETMYVQLYNDLKAIRPMPKFGTPRL